MTVAYCGNFDTIQPLRRLDQAEGRDDGIICRSWKTCPTFWALSVAGLSGALPRPRPPVLSRSTASALTISTLPRSCHGVQAGGHPRGDPSPSNATVDGQGPTAHYVADLASMGSGADVTRLAHWACGLAAELDHLRRTAPLARCPSRSRRDVEDLGLTPPHRRGRCRPCPLVAT